MLQTCILQSQNGDSAVGENSFGWHGTRSVWIMDCFRVGVRKRDRQEPARYWYYLSTSWVLNHHAVDLRTLFSCGLNTRQFFP